MKIDLESIKKVHGNHIGLCPVCHGEKCVSADLLPEKSKKYLSVIAGYNKDTHTVSCHNCGGREMFCIPRGWVPLRADGTPCTHEYVSMGYGHTAYATQHTCKHCRSMYIMG